MSARRHLDNALRHAPAAAAALLPSEISLPASAAAAALRHANQQGYLDSPALSFLKPVAVHASVIFPEVVLPIEIKLPATAAAAALKAASDRGYLDAPRWSALKTASEKASEALPMSTDLILDGIPRVLGSRPVAGVIKKSRVLSVGSKVIKSGVRAARGLRSLGG